MGIEMVRPDSNTDADYREVYDEFNKLFTRNPNDLILEILTDLVEKVDRIESKLNLHIQDTEIYQDPRTRAFLPEIRAWRNQYKK